MNGHYRNNAESQLQMAIGTLLESIADKSALVGETVKNSILKLSKNHPNQVLVSCCKFCDRNPKPSTEHISAILSTMEQICIEHIVELDGDTILLIIDFSLQIMIENSTVEMVIQMPASSVLVALGRKHHIQVLDKLLLKLEPGTVPHYMIPHTLGALANSNAYGVVPYIKNILTIMVPLLGGVKLDMLKQSFSYALGSFCEALQEYTSNLDQVPDNTITIESFHVEIGMSYDVLFTAWLQSREPKVIESVLNALSSIIPTLSPDKITMQTPKIIQTLLNLYKRQVYAFNVTKCLYSIIQKAANVNGTLLEPLLQSMLQHLSEFICVSPDYAQPDLLRNHSEVLRCYECLALYFTDSTIDHLILQLKNNNERERIKALLVITHLTSYSTDQTIIQRRFKDIIKHLNDMLNDPSLRVKKTLMKIIVAFANKGVLLNKEINPEGPERYIEFILKLCCKQNTKNENENQEIFEIQKSADNTLCMLSTSVPELETTLWNLLMHCFLGPIYDDAIIVLLRCLTHLASKKSTVEVCVEAFVKCLTLLAMPLPGFRGTFILNFLKNIRPCKNDRYKSVWEAKIPQLGKYLEQNYDIFHQVEWQELVYDFLTILLETVQDQEFNETLVLYGRKQLEMYNNNRYMNGSLDPGVKQNEKHFLLKCLAITLCHIRDKETILSTLDNILSNVKLTDFAELHACAEAVGICSRIHLQLVLDKLSIIRKDVLLKKSSKFFQFSFIKDQKHEIGIEKIRYVVISSYAEVCNEALTDKLLKVIESEILDFIVNELINCKDFAIRKICLKGIGSVADAMHPNRNSLHIRMNERDKILQLVSSQIHLHNGPEYIELFPVILPVITSLIRLPLPLESEQRLKLLKLCFDNIFNASAIYCKINADNSDNYYGELKLVPFVTSSFTKLNQLVQELLLQNLSPATLDEIVTLLEPWLSRKKAEQRLPAAETLRMVLQTYLDNMKFAYDSPSSFGQTGSLLAKIVPRATDPNRNIRKVAVESLCLVLCIASRYEGHMRDHDKQLTNSMQHIQQQIESEDPKLLYNLTSDIAHIICVNMTQFQSIHFVEGLIDALLDCEASSSSGSAVVLNMTLKSKGGELLNHVINVTERLIGQLDKIRDPRTKSSTLRAILSFATHHSKAVCQILLSQPLPYESAICECWSVLSTDTTLALDLIDQLKKIIKHTQPYEEQNNGEIRIATLLSLQAISALHELLKNSQLNEICRIDFPEIFSLLLVTLGSYLGTQAPAIKSNNDKKEKYFILNREAMKLKPAKVALESFKTFLICCKYTQMAGCLQCYTNIEQDDYWKDFLDVVATLVESVCVENSDSLSWIVASLGPLIRAELEPQRVTVVAFFSYLLRQKANNQTILAENLLEMVLDVHLDQSCLVRKLALQGLGFAAEYLNFELVLHHCHPILSVLMNSLDYNNIGNESEVILEGMKSFSKLLTTLEGQKFSSCQVTTAVRIKPLLDQEDVNLRRASFQLLGDLALSISPDGNIEAFREQIHGTFITLILHLCDPDPYVIKACKYTLRKVGVYLEAAKVNSMIQEHLIDEANLHYVNFIRDLIKVMAEEMQDLFNLFIMTSLSYLKSSWVEIRSSASLLVGLLFSHLTNENKSKISLDTVYDKLMRLLSDEHEEVRMRAVQAIAYLFVV